MKGGIPHLVCGTIYVCFSIFLFWGGDRISYDKGRVLTKTRNTKIEKPEEKQKRTLYWPGKKKGNIAIPDNNIVLLVVPTS